MAYNYAGRYGDLAIPFSGTKPGQRIVRSVVPTGLELPTWAEPLRLPWWRRMLMFFRILKPLPQERLR